MKPGFVLVGDKDGSVTALSWLLKKSSSNVKVLNQDCAQCYGKYTFPSPSLQFDIFFTLFGVCFILSTPSLLSLEDFWRVDRL